MRIVSRSEFLKMPPGTVFCSGSPWIFSNIRVLTSPLGEDYIAKEICPMSIKCESDEERFELLDLSMKDGRSLEMDFDGSESRDGFFERDEIIAVFEADDIKKLVAAISPGHRSETGLRDSNGKMICIGDLVRIETECNEEFHGKWTVFEVVLRGAVPALLYVESETGKKLPRGYIGCPLSDKYSQKMLLWATDLGDLKPESDMFVVDEVPNGS